MKNRKAIKYILLGTASLFLLFVFFHLTISFKGGISIQGNVARAVETEGPDGVLGWMVGSLLYLGFMIFSRLLAVAGKLLNWVFSIETFSGIPAINTGWGVLRDLANMFFIPILMVSAVATIVKYEKYSFRNMIKPLLIAVVFINFSRTIANVVIDFTQVLTRSFLSFGSAGGVSEGIINATGLTGIFQNTQVFDGAKFIGTWSMAVNTFLALLVVAIAAIVIGVAVVMLFTRMIMLWILIAISPIAWGLSVIPDTKGYLGKWWGALTKYAFFAPIFAFFIWFSIMVVRAGASVGDLPASMLSGTNEFFNNPMSVINYMFSIGILIFGLKYAQKNAGDMPFVGAVAKKAEGFIKGAGKKVGMAGKRAGMAPINAVKDTQPYRAAKAVYGEHKERVALKEKLKAKDAAITAGKLYKRKDAITTGIRESKVVKVAKDAEKRIRDIGTEKIKPLQWISREKSYAESVTAKRVQDETEKTRLEKLKEYKDAPLNASDVQKKIVDSKTSEGERKALAQYLSKNTDNFSDNMDEAKEEFKKALEALGGKDTAAGKAFVKDVSKTRLDLVVQNKSGENPGGVGFQRDMEEALKNMSAKDIAGQDMSVFNCKDAAGNNVFADIVKTLSANKQSSLARMGMADEKWEKIKP